MNSLVYEAEDLTLTNYLVESNVISSGDAHISLAGSGSNSGTATGIFDGEAGIYQVNIVHYDEYDGVAAAQVTVSGNVQNFKFDQDLTGNGPSVETLTSRVSHPVVKLETGDVFEIEGQLNIGEYARIDYIEFVPLEDIRYEAESLTLTGYQPESTNSEASGGAQITLSNTGFTSGTATGTFNGPAATYRVEVGYYDETDGVSNATVTVAGQDRSFLFDDDLGANAPVPEALTSRITHSVIGLKPGDTFEIAGETNFGEFARFDYINFSPVETTLQPETTSRYEAEEFEELANYVVVNNSFPSSGGKYITLSNTNSGSGIVSDVFDGETGFYQVKLGYFDENDGVSSATVTVGGQSRSLQFDKDLPSGGANSITLTEGVTHGAVKLEKGETFEIETQPNSGEFARLDYIDFVPVTPHAGSTYYVSPNGNDSNPGTELEPWETINYAVSKATPVTAGDTILVQPGVYTELVTLDKSGYEEAGHITLKADGNVIIRDPDPINGGFKEGVIQSAGEGYWIIDGFRIENSSWAGISLRDANNMIVQNNHTFETGASGIIVMPDTYFFGGEAEVTSKDIKVINNKVERANWRWTGTETTIGTQEALSIWGVDGFEVANNILQEATREGIDVKTGSRNGSIHHNTVTGAALISGTNEGYNGGPAIYVEGNRADSFNIDVYNNLVYGNSAEGIVIADEVPSNGDVRDVRVYNNVVYGNGLLGENSGAGIVVTSNVNDVEVINNTVVNNIQSIVIDGTDYTAGYETYDVLVRNNIFANAIFRNGLIEDASNVVLDNNLFTNGFNQLYAGGTGLTNFVETNNIEVPIASIGFLDLAGNDYHLSSGSAAIDSGSDGIPDYASIDIDGIKRDQDGDGDGTGEPDIGAYEYLA